MAQVAVGIFGAGQAVFGVIAEHKFNNSTACTQSTQRVGMNDHAFGNRSCACGGKVAAFFNFNYTNAAAGGLIAFAVAQVGAVAESRNIDIKLAGRLQNCIVCRNSYGFAVDSEIYSRHSFSYSMTIAFFGHPSIQAPHLMHLD